jgi:hypothetical protein
MVEKVLIALAVLNLIVLFSELSFNVFGVLLS